MCRISNRGRAPILLCMEMICHTNIAMYSVWWTVRESEIREYIMDLSFSPLATGRSRGQCMCNNTSASTCCACCHDLSTPTPKSLDSSTLVVALFVCLVWKFGHASCQDAELPTVLHLLEKDGAAFFLQTTVNPSRSRCRINELWKDWRIRTFSEGVVKCHTFRKKRGMRCVSQRDSMSQMVTIVMCPCVRSLRWKEKRKTQRLFWEEKKGKQPSEWVIWDAG